MKEAKQKEVVMDQKDLERMVEQYVDLKSQEDEIHKDVSNLNTQIKALMQELKIKECGPAKLSIQKRESINEEGIMDLLKRHKKSRGIVKTKEYVDWDSLEDAIYKGDISNAIVKEMDEYKTITEIPTLRISKKGK